MYQPRYVPLILLILAFSALSVSSTKFILHESRHQIAHWRRRDVLQDDLVLPMRIGLSQRNLDRGPDLLMEVSDPNSPSYGEHYTAEEVIELFAPRNESIEAVRNWLLHAGVPIKDISLSANRQWLQLDLTSREAGKLLNTSYHLYEDPITKKGAVGCDEYCIPEDLKAHIDYITPGVKLLKLRGSSARSDYQTSRRHSATRRSVRPWTTRSGDKHKDRRASVELASSCHSRTTPQCIMGLYNVTPADTAQKGNELGIFEDEAQYVDSEDLNLYFTKFYPTIPNGTFPIVHAIDGAKNKNKVRYGSTEMVDFEVSYPIIWPQNSVLYLTDDEYYKTHENKYKGFINTFLDGIDGSYCNYSAFGETGNSPIDPKYPDPNPGGYKGSLQCGVWRPTNVISISYALSEIAGGLPRSYMERQCNEYMKLGLQGITVVVASGDDGVASNAVCGKGEAKSISCNDGCIGEEQLIFNPNFPDTCPWVLSVGGTALPHNAKTQGGERAWSSSGGGFSNVFTVPSYQRAAVEKYFKSPTAPDYPYYTGSSFGNGVYNRTGRGVPDVSAIATHIVSTMEGFVEVFDGTSFATPIFAAILTRVNNERLAVGKSTVGFVNPVLYANSDALNDIVQGSNPGCNTTGFRAGVGWDAVTGLGSPNYPALLDVFMNLR